jgi:hypothetical protein
VRLCAGIRQGFYGLARDLMLTSCSVFGQTASTDTEIDCTLQANSRSADLGGGRVSKARGKVVCGLVLLGCAVVALSADAASKRWLGVFRPFPGAELVCSGHVLGQSEGHRVEIDFSLYSSAHRPSEVAKFYAEAHGLVVAPGQDSFEVKAKDGQRVLSVVPASAPHPECGAEPKPSARTVMVVSLMTR